MARRYTYSRQIETPEGKETFSAVEFDSFDEAINVVERGIKDRRLAIQGLHAQAPAPSVQGPNTTGGGTGQ